MRSWVVLFLLLISLQAQGARDSFHCYAAVGINYTPSSYRVGYGDWELGLLNQVFGFDKIFDFGSRYYTSFGFVYTGDPGFYGGIGLKFHLWFLPVRAELSHYIDVKGASYASGLLGVTYGF